MNQIKLKFDSKSPWLAPLAGFTDLPFRLLCREQGAEVCCTEMVSSKGLVYSMESKEQRSATQKSNTTDLLSSHEDDGKEEDNKDDNKEDDKDAAGKNHPRGNREKD